VGLQNMKAHIRRGAAVLITAIILTCFMRFVVWQVAGERNRQRLTEEHQLGPILEEIDRSGVDKEAIATVLMRPPSFLSQFAFVLLSVIVAVGLYSLCLRFVGSCCLKKEWRRNTEEDSG